MNNTPQNTCLIFFVKHPESNVKTRLSADLKKDVVRDLYKSFVLDILHMLKNIKCDVVIFFFPKEKNHEMKKWLGKSYSYHAQKGHDLGQRMKNAFEKSFSFGYKKAIIIGSDAPDLDEHRIKKAIVSLDNHDVVIGHSYDGGYYLLGFKENTFVPDVFENIEWSTNKVYKRTIELFNIKKYGIFRLPVHRDVDTLSDLLDLKKRNFNTFFLESGTMKYIKKNNI